MKLIKTSAELKREAREALSGRWKDAVLLNIVPSILSMLSIILVAILMGLSIFAAVFFMTKFSETTDFSQLTEGDISSLVESADVTGDANFLGNIAEGDFTNVNYNFSPGNYIFSTGISLVLSFITISVLFTFLDVLRDPRRKINPGNDGFRVFNARDFVPLALIEVLKYVFTYLWSLLFVFPGVMKAYAYSQSTFIYKDLSEHTDTEKLSAINYITESKLLMKGHKGRLFYIDLSFLGWHLVCWLTCGIGYLFLNPYMNATKAAFYRNVSQDRYLQSVAEHEDEEAGEWTSF